MRIKFEHFFRQLANFITQHAVFFISGMVILTVLLSLPIVNINADSSLQSYLKKTDPELVAYQNFKQLFGSDQRIIIGIRSANIFSKTFLERLRALHRSIESHVPYVIKVDSLLTAPILMESDQGVTMTTFLNSWPETPSGFDKSLTQLRSAPLYQNRYYTTDESFAILALSIGSQATGSARESNDDVLAIFDQEMINSAPDPNRSMDITSIDKDQVDELVKGIDAVVVTHQQNDFQLFPTGLPIYRQFVRQIILKDTRHFMVISTVVIAMILFVLLRRVSGVVLPLIVVFCSISSTLGMMAVFNRPIKTPTTILPSFLMAVGIGACVHVMTLFFRYLQQGNSRQEAISHTLGHSGLAITITSLTTAAGLFSFSIAEVAPIADLGLFSGIGVLLSFIYAIIFLPALLAVIPLSTKCKHNQTIVSSSVNRILEGFAQFSVSHALFIITFCGLLLMIVFIGITKTRLSHNPLKWFSETTPIRQNTEMIDHHLKGLINLEILIDSQRHNGFKSKEMLQQLEQLHSSLEALSTPQISVGRVTSLVNVIKHAHWSLNSGGEGQYRIPNDPNMLAQELLLIGTGLPHLTTEWVDTSYRIGRVTLNAPWVDAIAYSRFIGKIEQRCQEIFDQPATVTVTGYIPILSKTLSATMHSMVKSYLLAGITITLMMIFLIGNIKIGCLSMLPNLLPIFITLGIIGWLGIPMDMYTMLVGSIALGLAVDDTVHFMYHFRRYFEQTEDVKQAVHMTLQTAGRAMLITSMVMTSAALAFTFSSVTSLQNFGLITGTTIMLALLSDILLAPAIMALVYGKVKKG